MIVDLFGASRLDDQKHVERTLKRCLSAAGAKLVHIHTHAHRAGGVAGVAMLAEGHVTIRTWPDRGYAAVDLFLAATAKPDRAVQTLRNELAADDVRCTVHRRGLDLTLAAAEPRLKSADIKVGKAA